MRRIQAGTIAAVALIIGPPQALAQQYADPMIFVVAKGGHDACGPNCSQWIAAEGSFGPDTEPRFRDFLKSLPEGNLPVVFNSRGGNLSQGFRIGRLLRERRMSALVGETYPKGCKSPVAGHPSCRKLLQSKTTVEARLRTRSARCASACVYALLGASTRHVPANARIGIHASKAIARPRKPQDRKPDPKGVFNETRRYVLEMGGNPALVDAAARIPFHRVRYLSRDEIARYGLETRGDFETEWTSYEAPRPAMAKAITQSRGVDGKDYRTTIVRLVCADTRPHTLIVYQREPASNEIGVPTSVRVFIGGRAWVMTQGKPASRATAVYGLFSDRRFLHQAIAAGSIVFSEMFAPSDAAPWSRRMQFKTAGLEQGLQTPLKDCGGE
jgi:hypothetical protein